MVRKWHIVPGRSPLVQTLQKPSAGTGKSLTDPGVLHKLQGSTFF